MKLNGTLMITFTTYFFLIFIVNVDKRDHISERYVRKISLKL